MAACQLEIYGPIVHAPFPACSKNNLYTFVSYAHADAESVYPDLVELRTVGIEIWYDEGIEPGSAWREELGSAIEECDKFLFFLSSRSMASRHCQQELDFALELGRQIVVVYLEPVELTPGLRLSLNNRQALVRHELPQEDYFRKLSSALGQSDDESLAENEGASLSPKPRTRAWNKTWFLAITAALSLLVISALWFTERTPAPTSPTDLSEITSLAVLPFKIRDINEKDTYLGVSIAEELINALHKLEGLSLANRNDTFRTAANDSSMAEKAKSLNVQAILSGALQEQANRTRATLTLTYADGFELWTESVETDSGDPFVLQQKIVQTVLRALGESSQPGQEPVGPDFGTEDPEAYRLGTLGRQLASQVGNVNAVTKAIGLIEQALAIDPAFHELYPVLLNAKAIVGLHKNNIETFLRDVDNIVDEAKQAGAPRETVLKVSLIQAESRADLFQVERLSRELLSMQRQQEWDPLKGVSGPIFNYGLLLAMAGYYEDAEAYWRSLLPTANALDQQVFLEKKLLELELVAGNFGSVIGALGNCTDEAARALAPRGRCLPRLMRAQLGAGLADAALETARLHPNPGVSGYMIAVVNQDRQVLAAAVANTPPENWMTYYRLLLDNKQTDQAFEFWRNRFPFGGRHFLWDTIFMETAEHPHLWQDEGFLGLLYYYGMTPSWRKNICEGAKKASAFTGITPSCNYSRPEL